MGGSNVILDFKYEFEKMCKDGMFDASINKRIDALHKHTHVCLTTDEMGEVLKKIRRGIESVLWDMDYSITFDRNDEIVIRFGSMSTERAVEQLNNM